MKPSNFYIAAALAILVAGGAIWYILSGSTAVGSKAEVVMHKNAGCECCDKWAAYMQSNGYSVEIVESDNLQAFKMEQGIPPTMGACHTSLIDGYVVEGHVPAEDIEKLLDERPDAAGIVVPGMPASSPGMNTALNQPYDVLLLDHSGDTEVYSSH